MGTINDEEQCCGTCCWFYGEMVDGTGFCMQKSLADNMVSCEGCCKDRYFSRRLLRHYQAVLLQAIRWYLDPSSHRIPDARDYMNAIEFAYRYMSRFSKL